MSTHTSSSPTKPPLSRHVKKVFHRTHDPLWQMQLGVVIVMALQLLTSSTFLIFPKVWLIGIEGILLFVLWLISVEGYAQETRSRRQVAMILVAIVAIINIFSLLLLIFALFNKFSTTISGSELLLNGLVIYITNIFMFTFLYWEMDGGGPDRRNRGQTKRDFLFPQMIHQKFGTDWLPGFADYTYLSATNVTNFASADTLPLTHRAKMLMMIQSVVSVITVVLVLARAISILQ